MNSQMRRCLTLAGLALLAGCANPPEPVEAGPYDRQHLAFTETGFMEARTGWLFPQVLADGWVASQAWEYQQAVVGLEFIRSDDLLEIATLPTSGDPSVIEQGTVSVALYPTDFIARRDHEAPYLGPITDLLGLGHAQPDETEEFWAYQRELKARGYNLWKLVKLQVPVAPDRTFYSQLVLKKLNPDVSEGIILTVGQASDCYVVILIRRYVYGKDDVDQLGEWAYGILRELNLVAIREDGA